MMYRVTNNGFQTKAVRIKGGLVSIRPGRSETHPLVGDMGPERCEMYRRDHDLVIVPVEDEAPVDPAPATTEPPASVPPVVPAEGDVGDNPIDPPAMQGAVVPAPTEPNGAGADGDGDGDNGVTNSGPSLIAKHQGRGVYSILDEAAGEVIKSGLDKDTALAFNDGTEEERQAILQAQ